MAKATKVIPDMPTLKPETVPASAPTVEGLTTRAYRTEQHPASIAPAVMPEQEVEKEADEAAE